MGSAPVEEPAPEFSAMERRNLVRQALTAKGQTISLVGHESGGGLVLRLARSMGGNAAALAQLRLDSQGIGSLEDLKLGSTGFAYLTDEQGRPLVLPSLAKRLGEGAKGTLAFPFDGKEFVRVVDNQRGGGRDLLAAAPLESLGWGLAVRRSLDEAQAPAQRMLHELVAFTLAALVIGAVLALLLARPLVNNLLELASTARSIESGGDSGQGAFLKPAADEIGQVAGALTHMAEALRAQQQERERAHARVLAAEKRLAVNERLAALGQLSAGLAHELNNPLMVIHGAAGEAAADPKKAGPWLERIQRESERCSRLVRDLLDYARPKPPHARDFNMAELAQECFEAARTRREAPYALKLDIAAPRVHGDRDQFQQVLLNLFGNAMDAMPEGGSVLVALGGNRQGWHLSVRDQGQGVPLRSREAIFRPFFTSKPKGTGLGLAIARNLVEGHGGTLRCVAVRGKGACFELRWSANPRKEHA
jgi:two-component system NtrC family sensor kinase